MNRSLIIKNYPLLLSAMLLYSCSVPRYASKNSLAKMPDKFSGSIDSSSWSFIDSKHFFRDEHLQLLIRDVLQNNPEINIAEEEIKIASAYFKIRKGSLLPSLQMNARTSATRYGDYTMEGVGNYDTNLSPNIDEDQKIGTNPTPDFWIGLSSSWEIDLWGELRKMKKAAQLRYLASQQGLSFVKTTLTAQTASLYYELISLDNELQVLNDNIKLQEKALEIAEVQKMAGKATALAVQQFKAQLYHSKAAATIIKQKIKVAENNLNALAGKYGQTITRSKEINLLEETKFATGLPIQLLQNRPDLLQAESELAATKADALAARAAFFPSLNIGAYTAFNAFNGNLLFSAGSIGYQLAGGLTAPLFQKNKIRGQYNIANAKQEQAFYNYQQKTLNAYREVANSISLIESTQQILSFKKNEVEALEQGVSISNDLYLTGYANYLEIIAAQKSKLQAQLQLIHTQRDQQYAIIELYKSVGGGWR